MNLSSAIENMYINEFLPVAMGTAFFCAVLVYFVMRRSHNQYQNELREWRKFKKDNQCELIGKDETGFFGTKYIWKTKDGKTITNRRSK